jgi:hypothetical protein
MTVTQNQIPVTARLDAELNIRRAGRAATDLLPKGTPVPFIIALTNEMLQQASTVYEPDWRSNGPDQQPQDE